MSHNVAIIGLIVIVVIFFVIITIAKNQTTKFVPVKIGNATVNAELADNEMKQLRGLMFREHLPRNDGMLFTFSNEGRHGIWMMNTSISLDIIWLDKNRRVVHIEEKVPPCKALAICPTYRSESSSKYVLEVNSGFVKKHGIKKGSVAKFQIK